MKKLTISEGPKMADYNLIANFNVNVRVERFLLMDTGFGEPLRVPDIPYSQARLTMSDMEDIIEQANSVADNVTLFYKEDSGKETLTDEQLNSTRGAITNAVTTLVDNLTNNEFMAENVKVLHKPDVNNRATGLSSYIYEEEDGKYLTKVYLTYMPNILSATLIYPNRPGAIVNNFSEFDYSK